MTAFLTGAILALLSTTVLLALTWHRGWLKALSQRLFDTETAASRQQGLHFLAQYRTLLAQFFALNQHYQGNNLSLHRLPFTEAQQRAGEILALAEDLETVAQDLHTLCHFIARRVCADAATNTHKHTEPATEVRTPSPEKPKQKFKADAYYAIHLNDDRTDWMQKSGKQLNDLLEKGAIDGVDFFVVPLEFMMQE